MSATDLGADDHVVAVGEVVQGAAQDLLAGAEGVHVRGVEEVDARVQGVLDQGAAVLLAEGPDRMAALGLAVRHGPDGDRGDFQAAVAELDVAHEGSWGGQA
jgi:hypothetical protein